MKKIAKFIALLSFLIIAFSLFGGCKISTTKRNYGNVVISYDLQEAENYLRYKLLDENGNEVKKPEYGKNVVLSLSPANQNNLISYYPYALTVNEQNCDFTCENGNYLATIEVLTKQIEILVKVGCNKFNFLTEEHSTLFDVYYQDEIGNKLQGVSLGQTVYLTIEKNAKTLENKNECVVGYVEFNDSVLYSDLKSKNVFKKQITFTGIQNEFTVATFENSYEFNPVRTKDYFEVTIQDKNGNEIGYAPVGEEITITIKRNAISSGLESFYISSIKLYGVVLHETNENNYPTSVSVKFVSTGNGLDFVFGIDVDERVIRDD